MNKYDDWSTVEGNCVGKEFPYPGEIPTEVSEGTGVVGTTDTWNDGPGTEEDSCCSEYPFPGSMNTEDPEEGEAVGIAGR